MKRFTIIASILVPLTAILLACAPAPVIVVVTATPEPTATSIPTATPVPTITPAPTATPDLSQNLQEYTGWAQSFLPRWMEEFDVAANASRAELITPIGRLQTLRQEASEIESTSPEIVEVNQLLVDAFDSAIEELVNFRYGGDRATFVIYTSLIEQTTIRLQDLAKQTGAINFD